MFLLLLFLLLFLLPFFLLPDIRNLSILLSLIILWRNLSLNSGRTAERDIAFSASVIARFPFRQLRNRLKFF